MNGGQALYFEERDRKQNVVAQGYAKVTKDIATSFAYYRPGGCQDNPKVKIWAYYDKANFGQMRLVWL